MVDIEKLGNANGGGSSAMNVMQVFQMIGTMLDKVDKVQNNKMQMQNQQQNLINSPLSAERPHPQPQQPAQIQAPVTQEQKTQEPTQETVKPQLTDEQKDAYFQQYFGYAMKFINLYKMAYGDTTISVMKENLEKDKEQIKSMIMAQFK